MPQISQLPVAVETSTFDVVPISQNGFVSQVPLGTLFADTQSALTLASGVLLGRVSFGAGGPEPIELGYGLALDEGVLSVSGVRGPRGDTGAPGPQGYSGPIGATGASLHSGVFTPDLLIGQDGDTYVNGNTGEISTRTAGTWNVIGNFTGKPGQSLWSGTSAPATSLGNNNDTYINTANGDLFTRASNSWTKILNILGTPGRSLWNGTGAPPALLGVNGDSYVNTANGDFYTNGAGTWSKVNNIIGVAGRSLWNGTAAPATTLGTDGDSFVNTVTGDLWTRASGAWGKATNIIGAAGRSLWNGTSAPAPALGQNGDSFINTATGDLWANSAGTWGKVSNLNGTPGHSLFSGVAAPAGSLGTDGDSFINTATGDLFTRAAGAWSRASNIIGAAGRSLFSGVAAPGSTVGNDGDSYINTATGDLYAHAGGAWNKATNITGPSGRSMWSGATAPAAALGQGGDSFINTATGDLYANSAGTWSRVSNLTGTAGKSLWNGTAAPAISLGQSGDSFVNTATGDYWTNVSGTWSKAGSLTGAAGKSMFSGTSAPAGALGQSGDSYINTATGDLWTNAAGAWAKAANLTGTPGRSMLSGTTTPTIAAGNDGDSWINVVAGDIYTRAGGTWSKASNIIGPTGKSLLTGSAAPGSGIGNDGDSYINTATGDVYAHAAGLWNLVTNITGAAGASVRTGTAAPTTAVGSNGDSFVNTVTGDLWNRSSNSWTQVANIIGRSMRNGTGAPAAATGYDGDSYVNTANGDVWTRAAGVWSRSTNFTGATGRSIYNGAGAPAGALGANGDSYINSTNGDLYTNVSGSWTKAGNLTAQATPIPSATLLGGANNSFSTVALGSGFTLAGGTLQPDTSVLAPVSSPSFTGSVHMPDGSAAAPALAFASAPGSGMTHYQAGPAAGTNIGVVLGNSEVGVWGSGGDATTSPNGLVLHNGPLIVNAQQTWGYLNTAVGLSVVANTGAGHQAQVMGGFANLYGSGGPGGYAGRDSVTAYFENVAPAAMITLNNCLFTATTLVPATPLTTAQLAQFKTNMLIDTSHSPKYSGIVQSWTANAITVSGWLQMGNTSTGQVPPGSATAVINPVTKVWAINANATLANYSYATAAVGFELGINNSTGAYNAATDTPTTWGYDAVNLGNATVSAGFMARGDLQNGYVAQAGRNAAFCYAYSGFFPCADGFQTQQTSGTGFHVMTNMTSGTGFWTQQAGGAVLSASDPARGLKLSISATDGSLDIGAQGQGMHVTAAAVSAGGAGYVVGDTVTLANGTVLTVATITGGAVTTVTVTTAGTWSSFTNAVQTPTATSGGGSGATFAVTLASGITGSTPTIDFHTTGAPDDYNARIVATGGVVGTLGSATLRSIAQQHQMVDGAGSGFTLTGGLLPTLAASTVGFAITGTGGAGVSASSNGLTLNGTSVVIPGGLLPTSGQIELGGQSGTPTPAYVDFHTTGGTEDYNARLAAAGGTTGVVGSATLKMLSAGVVMQDALGAAFTVTLGGAPTIASNGPFTLTGSSGASLVGNIAGALTLTPTLGAFVNLNGPVSVPSGQVELGSQTAPGPAYIDFHITGGNEDYDIRLLATGATGGATGSGNFQVLASGMIVAGTGFVQVPAGTTAQQPATSAAGMLRFNSGSGRFEFYDTAWRNFLRMSGDTMTGPLALGANALSGSSVAFTGGTIDGTVLGATTPAAGRFTALAATTSLTPPSWSATPAGIAAGQIGFNTGTGRFDFGSTAGGAVNYLRLSGDTMTGALTVPALTATTAMIAPGLAAASGPTTLGSAGITGSGVQFLGAQGDRTYWKTVPTAGSTVAVPANVSTVQLVPAAALASLTVTLPAAPFDGQFVDLTSTQTITALTLAGGTVTNPPGNMAAGTRITLQYQAGIWICQHANTIAAITGGSINATAIGAAGASTGAFTTLAASGATTLAGTLATGAVTVVNTNSAVLAGAASGAVSLSASGTNVGLALVPSGTGALSAAVANSAASGGNARGGNAVDWQSVRALATQVASGSNTAIVGGANNTASGNNTTVGGNSNTVAANNAVAFGNGNSLSGSFTSIPGGYQANDNALFGKFAFASGMFAKQGDAQSGLHVLRAATSGTTGVRLTADGAAAGAANVLNLPNKGAYGFGRIVVLAFDNAGFSAAMWHVDGLLVTRGATAAATTIIGTPTVTLVQASAALSTLTAGSLAVSADITNGGVNFTITGTATALHVVARAASAEAA